MNYRIKSNRIESIDILRGLVMIIMALDHVRDYFHYGSFFTDPTNLETTTPFLFFTRFITHYCAPVFVFLAGTSAFLYGSKKTKPELFKFLFTRGIWLVLLEIFINTLIWQFDLSYSQIWMQVIWAIGMSMVVLSFLVFLPRKVLVIIGVLIVFTHNAFDHIVMEGTDFTSVIWYVLHQQSVVPIGNGSTTVGFYYPILPWIGIMILGYCLGAFYKSDYSIVQRQKWLLILGFGALILFFIIRGINVYGDLVPWTSQDTSTKTILSFFNVTKYPPSLAYTLITLGPALLFLFAIESVKNRTTDFLLIFGRVPLFFYFLHVLVIHILAIIGIIIFGGNWKDMILTPEVFENAKLINYGYSLFVVYLLWIGLIVLLYIPCKKYMIYKAVHKDKWWLSYL